MSDAFASDSFGSTSLPGAAGSAVGTGSAARAAPAPNAHSTAIRHPEVAARWTRAPRVRSNRRMPAISRMPAQRGQAAPRTVPRTALAVQPSALLVSPRGTAHDFVNALPQPAAAV